MLYLLWWMKLDVDVYFLKKIEYVLFCSLIKDQWLVYCVFFVSFEVEQIFDGNWNFFFGIDILRKICNYFDFLEREYSVGYFDYGNIERSGKLKVFV